MPTASWVGALVFCEGFDLLQTSRLWLCYAALLWCFVNLRISADQKFECVAILFNLIGLSRIPISRLENSARKLHCVKILNFLCILVCGFQQSIYTKLEDFVYRPLNIIWDWSNCRNLQKSRRNFQSAVVLLSFQSFCSRRDLWDTKFPKQEKNCTLVIFLLISGRTCLQCLALA